MSWKSVSPSQIDSYEKCPRSWYFKSILRIQEPQKGHQALGSAIHRITEQLPQGESWHASDVPDATQEQWARAMPLAQALIDKLPPQVSHRESGILLDTYADGPVMKGYVDLALRPGMSWPALMLPADKDTGVIVDFKTTSDWRYIKTPAELASGIQMMTYAKWGITAPGLVPWDQTPPKNITLVHLYVLTKQPTPRNPVREVISHVTDAQINQRWQQTLDTVREMQQVSQAIDADHVDPKGTLNGHCDAYGGCPFRAKCGLAEKSILSTFFKKENNPAMANPQTPGAGSALLARIQAAKAAAGGAAPAPVPVETGRVSVNTGIVPPDAPPREQAVITRPDDLRYSTPEPGEDDGSEELSGAPAFSPSLAGLIPADAAPAPKKRGRPSREEMARRAALAPPQIALYEPPAAASPLPTDTGDNRTTEVDGPDWQAAYNAAAKQAKIAQAELADVRKLALATVRSNVPTVYVDCYPMKGERPIDFATWVSPIAAAVAEGAGVADYRLINYTAKGLLASAMRELIKAEGVPAALAMSSMAPGADIALEVLTPMVNIVRKI